MDVAMPSRTILLVDADPLQRQLVDMLLAEDAPTITNAGTGREALEFLKEHTPHLVILAVELPDIGGDVVCGKLKSVSRLARVPVILTIEAPGQAGIPHDVRDHARSVGADLLVQKPLGDKNLRDRVRQLLARWDAPASPSARSTKNTVVIEEALDALGTPGGDDAAAMAPRDPITDALYRENEELRQEVASLKRRLARLEAGLSGRDGAAGPAPDIVAGAEPATPAQTAASDDPEEPPAGRPGDIPEDTVETLEHRVRELERRNKALRAALEEAEARGAENQGRGLFKRRRS
jgi:CheY-like chemotaxis protein